VILREASSPTVGIRGGEINNIIRCGVRGGEKGGGPLSLQADSC